MRRFPLVLALVLIAAPGHALAGPAAADTPPAGAATPAAAPASGPSPAAPPAPAVSPPQAPSEPSHPVILRLPAARAVMPAPPPGPPSLDTLTAQMADLRTAVEARTSQGNALTRATRALEALAPQLREWLQALRTVETQLTELRAALEARAPAAARHEALTPPRPGGLVPYVVQPGDTLTGLAARFEVAPDALAAANGITHPDQLVTGQRLLAPGPAHDAEAP